MDGAKFLQGCLPKPPRACIISPAPGTGRECSGMAGVISLKSEGNPWLKSSWGERRSRKEKMDNVELKATPRTATGRHVRALRRSGLLPAVIYGHNVEPISISLDDREATRVLARLSSSSLITINLEGKEYPSLVREKQQNHVRRNLIHVDFMVVSLTEKIRANVEIILTGNSAAVKDFNAMLINGLNELEVEALPQDLPANVMVDISSLVKIGDGIHVRDIVLSDKVHIMNSPDEMIVLATPPAKEEVEAVVTPEAAVVEEGAEPEVVEKGKKEEEGAGEEKK
jgi:large subunit ribosomal protein L25